jgi:hypothetical protein
MDIAHVAQEAVGRALRGVHAGVEKLASRKLLGNKPATIEVTSSAFRDGEPLPSSSTLGGADAPPPLDWSPPPPETESVVVLCEDPDAPLPQPFVHWLVYGIPAAVQTVTGRSASLWEEGRNSELATGFAAAAPPVGHGMHHYHFQVFALDSIPDLDAGAGRRALLDAMKGHVLAFGEIVGVYERG